MQPYTTIDLLTTFSRIILVHFSPCSSHSSTTMTPSRPQELLPSSRASKECSLSSRGTRFFHAATDEHGEILGWANQTRGSSEIISHGGLAGDGNCSEVTLLKCTFVLVENGGITSESTLRRIVCLVSSGESFSERFLRRGTFRTVLETMALPSS